MDIPDTQLAPDDLVTPPDFGAADEEEIYEKYERMPWEETIIYKSQKFFQKRFPSIGPQWASAPAKVLLSESLSNSPVVDLMGTIRPNIWMLYLGVSGIACKTPLKNITEDIAIRFDKEMGTEYLAPDDFTPEGFTEYITGTKESKKRDKNKIKPHPVSIIIKDEVSTLLGDIKYKKYQSSMPEYLSMLWDARIGGKYTRTMQMEGKVKPYVVFLGTGSNDFYRYLEPHFFVQGIGNRWIWIIEDIQNPDDIKEDDISFFLPDRVDPELEALVTEIIEQMKKISKSFYTWVNRDAEIIWRNYRKKIQKIIWDKRESDSLETAFLSKLQIQVVKLATIYAGARLRHFPSNFTMLTIDKEDMQRAVDDMNIYLGMWKRAMSDWRKYTEREQKKIPSSKFDLEDFIAIAKNQEGGYFTRTLMRVKLGISDKQKVADIIDLGVESGIFELEVEDAIPKNIIKKLHTTGVCPSIYKYICEKHD